MDHAGDVRGSGLEFQWCSVARPETRHFLKASTCLFGSLKLLKLQGAQAFYAGSWEPMSMRIPQHGVPQICMEARKWLYQDYGPKCFPC